MRAAQWAPDLAKGVERLTSNIDGAPYEPHELQKTMRCSSLRSRHLHNREFET
jgi:hypothetical protein